MDDITDKVVYGSLIGLAPNHIKKRKLIMKMTHKILLIGSNLLLLI